MGSQRETLDLLFGAAAKQLENRVSQAESLDRVAGVVLAFASAAAALTAPIQSRWLPAGRLLAAVSALVAVAALALRTARDVDVKDIRVRRWADETEDIKREIMDQRLEAATHVHLFNQWKSGVMYAAVILLLVALFVIGFGTL